MTRSCEVCAAKFEAATRNQRRCSKRCANRARFLTERPCRICGELFIPHVLTRRQRTCSEACRRQAHREADRERNKAHAPKRLPPAVARVVELLRKDPELETWQLVERGYDSAAVSAARKVAGVPAPRDLSKALLAAIRLAAPETYHGIAWAKARWRK